MTVVCRQDRVPEGVRCEAGWRCLRLAGQFDFTQVGVLASFTQPLAEAKISVFVVGTFDTDYLLVKNACLDSAFPPSQQPSRAASPKSALFSLRTPLRSPWHWVTVRGWDGTEAGTTDDPSKGLVVFANLLRH